MFDDVVRLWEKNLKKTFIVIVFYYLNFIFQSRKIFAVRHGTSMYLLCIYSTSEQEGGDGS